MEMDIVLAPTRYYKNMQEAMALRLIYMEALEALQGDIGR
jgi:hypothetical protein